MKIIIIKMEKKVLLKLFKAMLKKKIKIKKQEQVIYMKKEEKINNLILLEVKKKMKKNLKKMK